MDLNLIAAALEEQPDLPPIGQWDPPLSGDIDIFIDANGRWFHEGDPIHRQALVKLFASILRREANGDYVLVTPVEKWRIKVEDVPLQIVDFEVVVRANATDKWVIETNVGRYYTIGPEYPLVVAEKVVSGNSPVGDTRQDLDHIPMVQLDHGIGARFSRAAYYRLVESCEERDGQLVLNSGGYEFVVGTLTPPPGPAA